MTASLEEAVQIILSFSARPEEPLFKALRAAP